MLADDYVGYEVILYPTDEQKEIFERYFDASRFVYNKGIEIQERYYKETEGEKYRSLSFIDLNNIMTKEKKKYEWLKNISAKTITIVIKDVTNAYHNFFNNRCRYPKYKKKKHSYKQFPIGKRGTYIFKDHVQLPSIGIINTNKHGFNEIIGRSGEYKTFLPFKNYTNLRVIYDGLNYKLTFSLKQNLSNNIAISSFKKHNTDEWNNKPASGIIGIDIGCKKNNWIKDSNGSTVSLPDMQKTDKAIAKTLKKLNRQFKANKHNKDIIKMGMINKSTKTIKMSKEGYTKNEIKTLDRLNKLYKKKVNQKKNTLYNYINNIIDIKPKAVVIEDLYASDMIITDKSVNINRRKCHNRRVNEAMIHTVKTILQRTLEKNNIEVVIADKHYPSTQICSSCGYRQNIGKHKIYKCPNCGLIINRDMNASLNLKNYYNYIDYNPNNFINHFKLS